jgi:hypothetical protein
MQPEIVISHPEFPMMDQDLQKIGDREIGSGPCLLTRE